jgi:hypothetical protein
LGTLLALGLLTALGVKTRSSNCRVDACKVEDADAQKDFGVAGAAVVGEVNPPPLQANITLTARSTRNKRQFNRANRFDT